MCRCHQLLEYNCKVVVFNLCWSFIGLEPGGLELTMRRRKETNIPWVTQPAFVLQEISQKQRERDREREKERKERHGDPSSDGAKVL